MHFEAGYEGRRHSAAAQRKADDERDTEGGAHRASLPDHLQVLLPTNTGGEAFMVGRSF